MEEIHFPALINCIQNKIPDAALKLYLGFYHYLFFKGVPIKKTLYQA